MLKKRIIPTLLYNGDSLVKGQGFDPWRRIGSIVPAVRVYNQRDVDELMILDVSASRTRKPVDLNLIQELAPEIRVPLSVGGGIASIEDAREILRLGADKVVLNTVCYENPSLITKISRIFGSQAVVCSIDVRRKEDGTYRCVSQGGEFEQSVEILEHIKQVQSFGVGEIMLTVVDDEGMMNGFDRLFYEKISKVIDVPLIVAGGVRDAEDVRWGLNELNASAVGISSLFSFTEMTPKILKDILLNLGCCVRK
jgi:cyclase